MENNKSSQPMIILATATGINVLVGLIYIWSVIGKALITEFGWTAKQASMPYTVTTVGFVLSMVAFGKIQDNKGPRFTATIASILTGIGLILSGMTQSPFVMVITFGIITGCGVGMMYVAALPPALKWFAPAKRGVVTGVVVGGIGFASVIYSPLSHYLIGTVGVSKTFLYIGSVVLIATLALSQLLKNPPEGYVPQGGDEEETAEAKSVVSGPDVEYREMLRTTDFYKMWIMLAFSSSAGLMIIGHIANIARIQCNWSAGFILVIILSIFNTGGRIGGGDLSDRIGRIKALRLVFALQTVNMMLFPFYGSPLMMGIGVSIAGLCYGAGFAIFPAMMVDKYGQKFFGSNYGVIFTAWGVGGIIGPMAAAAIFDASGSYYRAYMVAGVLMVIALVIALVFKSETKVEAESDEAAAVSSAPLNSK